MQLVLLQNLWNIWEFFLYKHSKDFFQVSKMGSHKDDFGLHAIEG